MAFSVEATAAKGHLKSGSASHVFLMPIAEAIAIYEYTALRDVGTAVICMNSAESSSARRRVRIAVGPRARFIAEKICRPGPPYFALRNAGFAATHTHTRLGLRTQLVRL
jgi:hypothetical protein